MKIRLHLFTIVNDSGFSLFWPMALICVIGEADPFIARLLDRFAEESGLLAYQAAQGEDLVKMVRDLRPAVIILEVELPGKVRGWEAIKKLRSDPVTMGIPIISCSWASSLVGRGLIDECCTHLQKPELYYSDFQTALKQAGIDLPNRIRNSKNEQSDE